MSTQAVALRSAPARPLLAGAWLVSGATLASGLLTYAFHVLAARALGAEAYGQIAVLWAALFLAAIVLCRPVEQTASRSLADRLARGEEVDSVLRTVALLSGIVLVLTAIGTALGWGAVRDRLFQGDGLLTGMLALGIALYVLAYAVRGIVTGIGWFGGYGLGLFADSVARIVLVLPVVALASPALAAVAVSAAAAAGVVAPLVACRARLRLARSGSGGARFRPAGALAFAAPASVVAAADQLFVNGAPILVVLAGGPEATAAAGIVFAATMLVRVPVFLFHGLSASLLPNLTHLHALDDHAAARRAAGRVVCWMLVAGAVVLAGAAVMGPEALRLVYGEEFDAGRAELAVLAAGIGCYLAAGALAQALLAVGHATRAAAAKAISAAVFVGLYATLPGSELVRLGAAFAGGALCALALLALALVLPRKRR